MEESLQNTLVLAQRTADEVKASAHKEADLIRAEARVAAEREVNQHGDAAAEARREHQRALEAAEKAKSELRSLLSTHLALLEMTPPVRLPETLGQPSLEKAPPVEPPIADTERVEVAKPDQITVY